MDSAQLGPPDESALSDGLREREEELRTHILYLDPELIS